MNPVFLLGYMGSGKTTLGKSLSRTMKLDFIDLDNFIEGRFHCTIKELFAKRGEEGFRAVEQSVLHEVGEFNDVIIACGGGTPCFFDNMEFMNAHGTTVFLDASEWRIFERLTVPSARAKRPLIASKTDEEIKTFITEALAARRPFYSKAKIIFNADRLESIAQLAESTNALIEILQKV